MEGKKQIELRSEKVRNIIGQVPPVMLRYGISIIGLSICILVVVLAIIPYSPDINSQLEIRQADDGSLSYTVNIAKDKMKYLEQITHVICERAADLELPANYQIGYIDNTLQLRGDEAWYVAEVIPQAQDISAVNFTEKTVVFPAKIMLSRRSLLRWLLRK